MKQKADIIVVGGGMVGLAAALALAKKQWQIVLIESDASLPERFPEPDSPFDTRVVAISRASEKLFHDLNVWSKMEQARISPYQQMAVWDEAADGKIHFHAADFFEPNLGYIIEQQVIKAALWQAILRQSAIQIIKGQKVTALEVNESEVSLTLSNGEMLHAKLVVGADGASSSLRKLSDIGVAGWDYEQSALVATIEGSKSHAATAFQRFSPDGPLALLPLAHPYQSSIVWTCSNEEGKKLMALPQESFNALLTRESHGVIGEIKTLSARKLFPLRTHHAKDYAVSRCVLVGDAAHTLHPLAGQGVNLGFKDVVSLVKVLANAKARKRDIGNIDILKKYQRERKGENQRMIFAMEAFKRGFATHHPVLVYLRNCALNFADKNLWVKQFFAKMALN